MHLSYDERELVNQLVALRKHLVEGEWHYSKNSARVERIFGSAGPDRVRRLIKALDELLD